MVEDADELTPTEYLVGEVLIARERAGETHWTFPTRVRPSIKRLAERGIVGYKSGVVPKTCIVWFTDEGRKLFTYEDYDVKVVPKKKYEELARATGLGLESLDKRVRVTTSSEYYGDT